MARVDMAKLAAIASALQAIAEEDVHEQKQLAQPLRVLNVMELGEYRFPERVQLLGPLIHAGDLAVVFAGRGVGKTQVCLSISAAPAIGAVFLRWKAARPVGVLYLDAEMAGAVMQQRVASFIPDDASEDSNDPPTRRSKVLAIAA